MISLLLAIGLGQVPDVAPVSPAPPDSQEMRVPCESTPAGWVCKMPAMILRPSPPGSAVITDAPAISVPVPPTAPTLTPPVEIGSAEADRQARLIARCADASWLSLCLPDDRREARALRDAAVVRAALRREVYQLLSENRCDDAMRRALAGADTALVREVQNLNVCAPGPATAEAAADTN